MVSGTIAADERHRRRTAEWVLRPAGRLLIVELVKKVQALKGRTYREVAEKTLGDAAKDIVERTICEMMESRCVSQAELVEWYRIVIETVYERTKFQPLPDYASCVVAVEEARQNNRLLREAAERSLDGTETLPALIAAAAERTRAGTLPELFAELKRRLA